MGFQMLMGLRAVFAWVLMGVSLASAADSLPEMGAKVRLTKPAVHLVKQKDGSVVERLDLAALGQRRQTAPAYDWLRQVMDPALNGLSIQQPDAFAEWLDAVTEPRFMTALATLALDPDTMPKTLNQLSDPATARQLAESIDPRRMLGWMTNGMDPKFYVAVFQRMANPNKYLRWAGMTLDAKGLHADPEASSEWLHMPGLDAGANPWLAHSRSYRY